jgi:glucokinase
VVFGGGVVEALDEDLLAPIRVTARQYFIQRLDGDKVRIVPAELGDHAVAIGAAVLVGQQVAGIGAETR